MRQEKTLDYTSNAGPQHSTLIGVSRDPALGEAPCRGMRMRDCTMVNAPCSICCMRATLAMGGRSLDDQ